MNTLIKKYKKRPVIFADGGRMIPKGKKGLTSEYLTNYWDDIYENNHIRTPKFSNYLSKTEYSNKFFNELRDNFDFNLNDSDLKSAIQNSLNRNWNRYKYLVTRFEGYDYNDTDDKWIVNNDPERLPKNHSLMRLENGTPILIDENNRAYSIGDNGEYNIDYTGNIPGYTRTYTVTNSPVKPTETPQLTPEQLQEQLRQNAVIDNTNTWNEYGNSSSGRHILRKALGNYIRRNGADVYDRNWNIEGMPTNLLDYLSGENNKRKNYFKSNGKIKRRALRHYAKDMANLNGLAFYDKINPSNDTLTEEKTTPFKFGGKLVQKSKFLI